MNTAILSALARQSPISLSIDAAKPSQRAPIDNAPLTAVVVQRGESGGPMYVGVIAITGEPVWRWPMTAAPPSATQFTGALLDILT